MKKFLIQVCIFKKIFLFIALLSINAQAETREFTYQVYAGGINAVEAKMNLNIESNTYDVAVTAKTQGLLGSLAPWEGRFHTQGKKNSTGNFAPTQHQSISIWRGEKETKTFSYKENNLTSITIAEDGKPVENRELDPALIKDTTDILSATLMVMNNFIPSQKCDGSSDIYDGKRRFSMEFKDKGAKNISKSGYNIFSGPARLCTIEVQPKGGRWHDKPRGWFSIQEQGRSKGTLPSIWMAQIEGYNYAVPVKVMVKTDYGTLLMHLTDVK